MLILLDVLPVSEPFSHFRAEAVFSDSELLKRLGGWLHEFNSWQLQETARYSYYAFDFSSQPLSPEARELASPEMISVLLRTCEEAFATSFLGAIAIGANKLVPNQYMAVHTDSSTEVTHTHRLVVQIPGPDQLEGGDLLLFKSRDSTVPTRTYPPTPNTAFGFQFESRSFHAVSPIVRGERYSLIINLRASQGLAADQILASLPPRYVKRLFWAKEPKPIRSSA